MLLIQRTWPRLVFFFNFVFLVNLYRNLGIPPCRREIDVSSDTLRQRLRTTGRAHIGCRARAPDETVPLCMW